MRLMRRRMSLAAALVVIVAVSAAASPYFHGLSFVVRAADVQGFARRVADLDIETEREREISIPTSRGPLRARLYEPAKPHHRAALLVSGLHPAGIDEPRLVGLARQLASSATAIVTPDIPELSRFAISPAITEDIEEAAGWIASSDLAPDRHVALMGISFSGGLSIVAAGRPSLRDRVAYVFAFGGHDDLPRVLRYLCTGVEPPRPAGSVTEDGRRTDNAVHRPPHDYGVAVILLGIADRVVPHSQVAPLRAAVQRFLWASHLDRIDKAEATREFDALRDLAATLPEPSATLLRYVNSRDVAHLGPVLLPYIGYYGGDPALSVSKSPRPSAPVFLLHGTEDNVIPAVESEYLAADLRGHAPVRLLLSGLVSHAEADQPMHVGDVMKLAAFWGDLLQR